MAGRPAQRDVGMKRVGATMPFAENGESGYGFTLMDDTGRTCVVIGFKSAGDSHEAEEFIRVALAKAVWVKGAPA